MTSMCRIAHTIRINGRYVFRRRVHFRNLISKPVSLALQTADPKVARRRAAMLSARFVVVKQEVERIVYTERTSLTGVEIEAIFRRELEAELVKNLADAYSNDAFSSSMAESAVPLAEAFRFARRPDRPRDLTSADRADMERRGVGYADREQAAEYLRDFCHVENSNTVRDHLAAIGVPPSTTLIEIAKSHVLRARYAAWRATERVFDDAVMDAVNPLQALMDIAMPSSGSLTPPPVEQPRVAACPFIVFDPRPFSESIDQIIAELRQEDVWKGTCSQQRRIMQTFAWITGDKPRGAYNHLDPDVFKRGLMKLPRSFSFGTFEQGAMSRPFAEAVAETPVVTRDDQRHAKTVNRDLSTMSRVSKHLAKTIWKPSSGTGLVLDFAATTLTVKPTGEDPRPPWRPDHIAALFSSPLYTGNSGKLRRLVAPSGTGTVYHDAAYWLPLLLFYHHTCREETAGLRVDEVVIDTCVPYFEIKDNDVRGRDGELAGEKRLARRRKLPLHDELIRLGFLDYVAAIRDEGHVALFPELYLFDGKRGGAQFYARAWTHMVNWIGDHVPLPRNRDGKGPDMHSIRALGSSFYEVDGVNEIMRADVMGHARTTVNGISYSKRVATEGLDTVLAERKAFIAKYVPALTTAIAASPIRLLPLEERSRVGSGRARKRRNDAGNGRGATSTAGIDLTTLASPVSPAAARR